MEKYCKLEKIISGGQTGADMGGLIAARSLHIDTGGTASAGFRTENGPTPKLATDYHLQEGSTINFKHIAQQNIMDADATVVFSDSVAAGTILTMKLCKELQKPCRVSPTPEQLVSFLDEHSVAVLHVSGNKESDAPGIMGRVVNILTNAIKEKN